MSLYTPQDFIGSNSEKPSFSQALLSASVFEPGVVGGIAPQTDQVQPEFLVLESPFASLDPADRMIAMLAPELLPVLRSSDILEFSSPVDNLASGQQADFRLLTGTDGVLRLEPLSADPLADGKLNIEIETGNQSLAEAIRRADANLKEHIREMIVYWTRNHPGRPYPSWWQDILNSEPFIPGNPAPVPIMQTPPEFRPQSPALPEPPSAPSQGWQPDYRQGGGRGYGGASGGGTGSPHPGAEKDYYHGGKGGSEFSVPNSVSNMKDSTAFVDRVAKAVMKNEGSLNADGSPRFTAYNPDDNGGISVGLRQWHAGGALPELLNAWKDKNPQKFEELFHGYSPAQINSMSSKEFGAKPELVAGMKHALADKEYQGVQVNLIKDWVKREVQMGMNAGLTSEKELAVFVDIANQYGQTSANRAACLGKVSGDQASQMNSSVRGSDYGERFAFIDKTFTTQRANLHEQTPSSGDFGVKLASAVKNWDGKMSGQGNCAAAVQRALADVGHKEFLGSGNAWDMLGPLERSGHFVRVSESEAQVGDLILRPPSANQSDNSVYGDISVVTSKKGNEIIQTNDDSYKFERNNQRYDGKAVFLRYVGDNSSSDVLLAAKKNPHEKQVEPRKTAHA